MHAESFLRGERSWAPPPEQLAQAGRRRAQSTEGAACQCMRGEQRRAAAGRLLDRQGPALRPSSISHSAATLSATRHGSPAVGPPPSDRLQHARSGVWGGRPAKLVLASPLQSTAGIESSAALQLERGC